MAQPPREPHSEPEPDRPESVRGDLDAKLAAEIEAALGDMSLEDMLDLADRPRPLRASAGEPPRRNQRTGRILRIHGDDVFVEFGPRSPGVCPRSQFDNPPTVGERMEFLIDRFDEKDGLLILSRPGSVRKAAWESLEVGQVVDARCTGVNKGGLDMEVADHRAFMPAGQVDLRHIADLSVFVGDKMTCEVIELDRRRSRIVLSRRGPLVTERAQLRDKLLATLEVGQELPAVITSIKPYGAFADLGGVDGLIHISDLSYERVKDPSEVVKEGDQVQVKVLKIDRESADGGPRIGLGMKQCLADPYHATMAQLTEGDTVRGKVTRIMPYGAFVELAPGVEGLIHISQLSQERVNKVSQFVKPDEIVNVKVLDIDKSNRRIGLSLRAVKKEQEEQIPRPDDPEIRKLKAKFGGELKGGIG